MVARLALVLLAGLVAFGATPAMAQGKSKAKAQVSCADFCAKQYSGATVFRCTQMCETRRMNQKVGKGR